MESAESTQFTELTACATCGTLWKREFKNGAEQLEIVAKRLRKEPHLTEPPNGHRIVFWKCHTCGADHIDDTWTELLATVGVRDSTAAAAAPLSTPAKPSPSGNNPFQGSPSHLLRPPVLQR
ncbi:hypothetical protein Agub_g15455 [Astrephomene gubernaculifera]|uniref:Uncharacterized protein n=1 Tax=Astrephomene gubernaculifera TaxID=47775 RepID=A0AAD3DTH9_9CHLO|nr:hypothetical protein Agub_g7942 [Astrephomene gubernaculifera]GFR52829.1 hypothetical protein Agub_g15455 [Astrephomene gubernaculifera]